MKKLFVLAAVALLAFIPLYAAAEVAGPFERPLPSAGVRTLPPLGDAGSPATSLEALGLPASFEDTHLWAKLNDNKREARIRERIRRREHQIGVSGHALERMRMEYDDLNDIESETLVSEETFQAKQKQIEALEKFIRSMGEEVKILKDALNRISTSRLIHEGRHVTGGEVSFTERETLKKSVIESLTKKAVGGAMEATSQTARQSVMKAKARSLKK